MEKGVTRNGTTYYLRTRAGQATVSNLVPFEDRATSQVVRWGCRLTLTQGGVTLAEDFQIVPDPPFKSLGTSTKLDLQRVLEKFAFGPEVEQYVGRFEEAYAHVPNAGFLVSQLAD